MTTRTGVLIVGASAAGLSTAEALRRGGYEGQITMIGAELHAPYDRPPLSKQVLSGSWTPDRAVLRPEDHIAALGLDIGLGEVATSLDVDARTVRTSRRVITADHIVIATGAHPRTLPGQPAIDGLHSFRFVDDAAALRTDLLSASRLVIVGDGVLGAEIAATARGMGLEVTIVGPQTGLMESQLGPGVAGHLTELHASQGVGLRLGEQVVGFAETDGRTSGVELASGETLPADVVVVAVGAIPATGWLEDSDLEVADGVVCDANCRAAEGIYAAGDVARIRDAATGSSRRLENRTNATEHGMTVAAAILEQQTRGAVTIPYFWTDQFATKIQVDGFIPRGAEMSIVDGDPATGRFVAAYVADGVVTGIVGWNMAKQSRRHRGRIGQAVADQPVGVL
ncbi:FAD-dependent oxidoreductase [Gordonia sp. PKS22-38]|uniref:FAD-dependent oxidoreductase n=1 Tax=Gordonia prachuapensis TaxID=3115651 RepID=A0ABU7MSW9_9ACTN|nr:FAD-dependent oxidoreductase [Gordonia sp. PKS22-38]